MVSTAPIAGVVVFAGLCALAGCSKIPDHDGYPKRNIKGWEKPTKIEFDEDREAEADGELSYPARQRARWYAVELPDDGRLELRLNYLPLGMASDDEEEDDPLDVAIEVYDETYRLLLRANNEEDDAGDRKKTRVLEDLAQGRYLIHLYLQRRFDSVEYTLRLQHRAGAIAAQTDFPRNVRFPDPMPLVPAVDDAPPPPPKCQGRRCGRGVARPGGRAGGGGTARGKDGGTQETQASDAAMRGRITGVRATDDGTRITINRGQAHGVAKGWKGRVVSKSGAGIPNGSFTITQVKANESHATVRASADTVSAAANVVLSP